MKKENKICIYRGYAIKIHNKADKMARRMIAVE